MKISTIDPATTANSMLPQIECLGSSRTDLHRQCPSPDLVSINVKPAIAKAPLRVLLADDHEMLRLGTATFLKTQIGCEICGEASDGREALKLAESTRPDVAVIDLGLPGLNGLEVTRQIRRFFPQTEVVILSGDNSADATQRVLEAGAKAFIRKVDAIAHLADAVQMVGEHRFYLTPQAHETLHQKKATKTARRPVSATPTLTSRERETIQLLAEGKSNKEVADLLGISVKTVETHRAAIMRKLKLAQLSQLVRYAIRHKIIHA
jgi:DNA-binding NarL/FixJ family response regulator